MTGALECQCKKDIKAAGPTGLYLVYDDVYNFEDTSGNLQTEEMCKAFIEDEIKAISLNNGIKYMIIGLNYAIRVVVVFIIKFMRCSSESNQMIYITNMVFIC